MENQPRYQLRARFHGVLDWLCPWCCYVNKSHINRTSWRVRCKGKDCRRQFTFGTVLHSLANLRQSGRKPVPPPDVTFPLASLDFWESGAPVHRLVLGSENAAEEVAVASEG